MQIIAAARSSPVSGNPSGAEKSRKEPAQENQPVERPAKAAAPARQAKQAKYPARIQSSTAEYMANLRKKYRTNTSGAPVLDWTEVCVQV
jgi:hypothetical protein